MDNPINIQLVENELRLDFIIERFSTKHLSSVANIIYENVFKTENKKFKYVFGLSKLEWIGHEELVFISALFHYLFNQNFNFFVNIKQSEHPNNRQALQIIQLWENWRIHSFVPFSESGFKDYNDYFDIDDSYIKYLKQYILKRQSNKNDKDIYDFKNITPFYPFIIKDSIDEKLISDELDELHSLDEQTEKLLNEYKSETPFLNKTLSRIISKELVENSIEHAYDSIDGIKECYFGISLKNKITKEIDTQVIQNINEKNFKYEAIPESIRFYKPNDKFINQSFLQYTFIDFGQGISQSLKEDYVKNKEHGSFNIEHSKQSIDTRILEYAFNYNSSRHPIDKKYLNRDSISRGLFDVLSIVHRYKGVIIARSNYGKILYDFSKKEIVNDSIHYFDRASITFFPGTIITLFIPESENDISHKSIKPKALINIKGKNTFYLSFQKLRKEIEKELETTSDIDAYKSKLYNLLFERLNKYLDEKQSTQNIIYVDFQDSRFDFRIAKKILMYLASDYRINETTNAIIINSPEKEIVRTVQDEILNQEKTNKFHFHPIPCFYYDNTLALEEVIWIGIKSAKDQEILNKVLKYELNDFRKDDFSDPEDVLGNLFSFDKFGNLISNLKEYGSTSIEAFVAKNTTKKENTYFLSSGNYYQDRYITFLETLQDEDYAGFIANQLVKRLINQDLIKHINVIISITLSSQLLAKAILSNFKLLADVDIEKLKFIRLSHYNSFESEDVFQDISENDSALLVCDVISTGHLVYKLSDLLKRNKATLIGLSAIVDTRIANSKERLVKCYFEELCDINMQYLYSHPIDKLRRAEIKDFSKFRIERINPITNSSNTLSKSKSYPYKIIYPDNEKVLELYPKLESFLKIGCFYYNNVFHSYYFETHKLLKSSLGVQIVADVIQKLKSEKSIVINELDYLFYPVFSGAEVIEHDIFRRKIFKNHKLRVSQIARFITPHGWRFSFPPKFLNDITKDKNIFIIDDGSVSGATISQMIDEICFLEVKSITFLSIFGRLEDYQREFFSRIEMITAKMSSKPIPINIFFGMNWNISVYTLGVKNPFYKEREFLEKYIANNSIPPFIKEVVQIRHREIKLYHPTRIPEKYSQNELSYLPKIRKETSEIIPFERLFVYRDLIGKIAGYRFYSEYFEFFDEFINYYNNKSVVLEKSRYQRVELLLGVILHEPKLADTIREILPDINEKLEEFTKAIVIDNAIPFKFLYYDWKPAAFVRLYFILHRYNFSQILNDEQLSKIFDYCTIMESSDSLSHVFYFLMNEIPISKEDIKRKEFSQEIDKTIKSLINQPTSVNINVMVKLKQFSSFMNTNPYIYEENDEKTSLNALVSFYMDEQNIQFHNDCLSSQFARLLASLDDCLQCIIEKLSIENEIATIKKEWDAISNKIERFLKPMANLEAFSHKFFKGKLYNLSHKNEYSFQSILQETNEKLFSTKESFSEQKLKNIHTNVRYLIRYLVEDSSEFVQLFTNQNTLICNLWDELILSVNKFKFVNRTVGNVHIQLVKMHYLVLKDVLFEKVINNFRHASFDNPIEYEWKISPNHLSLEIKNKIDKTTNCTENGSPIFADIKAYYDFQYVSKIIGDFYYQNLKFKISNYGY